MKENRKLLREVLQDIRRDMTDEEVLNLLADSKISVGPDSEKSKYTLGQRAADAIAKFAGSWAFIFSFTGVLIYPAEDGALVRGGHPGAAVYDESESAGVKGPPPGRKRLQGQPENRNHD